MCGLPSKTVRKSRLKTARPQHRKGCTQGRKNRSNIAVLHKRTPHYHYGGEEFFCANKNSRLGFTPQRLFLHRKGTLFNFSYSLYHSLHDYFYVPTDFDTIEKAFSGVKTAEKGMK